MPSCSGIFPHNPNKPPPQITNNRTNRTQLMGYSASIKCFVHQLSLAQPLAAGAADQFQLHGCAFSRAWVQGVVVQVIPGVGFFIDDGSGCVAVQPDAMSLPELPSLAVGSYVQAIGFLGHLQAQGANAPQLLCVGKAIVAQLDSDKDQETLWWLEVMDAQTAVARGAVSRLAP